MNRHDGHNSPYDWKMKTMHEGGHTFYNGTNIHASTCFTYNWPEKKNWKETDHTLKILTNEEQEKDRARKRCRLKEYHNLKAEFVNMYGLLSSCHMKQLALRQQRHHAADKV
jgi:hypothetical protein